MTTETVATRHIRSKRGDRCPHKTTGTDQQSFGNHRIGYGVILVQQESVMTKKPDKQIDKNKTRPTQTERDVSDPHPGSVSDGTHPEANEDKSED